jgi:hypothetical protein
VNGDLSDISSIDWKTHDSFAPDSIYVRLAKPGDILKFTRDHIKYVVQEVTKSGHHYRVKFENYRMTMLFGEYDRAKLWYRKAGQNGSNQ